jgi:inner membrane protein
LTSQPLAITVRVVDNLCHTLVGGILAQAGLKRRSAGATATLLVAANLPDVDVLAIPMGHGLEWRRGSTHGPLGLVLGPLILTGLVLLWFRLRPPPPGRPVRASALLLVAFLGVATHPFLDYLNVYGMRWLMPFADRWYYGDSLFIVDVWLWILFAAGIGLSRRAERAGRLDWFRPARLTLAAALWYGAGMVGATAIARHEVARAERGLPDASGRFMVAPVPVDPFRKAVVSDRGDHYAVGTIRLLGRPTLTWTGRVDRGPIRDPAVVTSARTPAARGFLHWARFPVARLERRGDGVVVRWFDLRYSDGTRGSFGSIEVSVPGTPLGSR